MNFTTQESLVGIMLGVAIILIIGTGVHLIQNGEYFRCVNTVSEVFINTTSSECIKPTWWFGL
jgi:hypothetical protein